MHRTPAKILAATAASVLTAGLVAGTAVALTTPHATTTFYACERTTTKAVSGISASPTLHCPAGYTKVTWSCLWFRWVG